MKDKTTTRSNCSGMKPKSIPKPSPKPIKKVGKKEKK